jgi:hypothetical protein
MQELDFSAAADVARAAGSEIDAASCVELEGGWFFPSAPGSGWRMPGQGPGLTVDKVDGAVFQFGSRMPLSDSLDFYNRGYRTAIVDLVILAVQDVERSLDLILDFRPSTVDVSYEAGTVWRIGRDLTRSEIGSRLNDLPCVFEGVSAYSGFPALRTAEDDGAFSFRAVPRPG